MGDPRWQGLYRMGGTAALVIAALLLGEVLVYVLLPRTTSALEHFTLFQRNVWAGLLTLDLLGMIAYLVFIPTILALYVALRRSGEAVMLVATVLFFVGIAAFFASNTAFAALDLSIKYSAAQTDAERAMFLAAGEAMFALFNENAFLVSYLIVSAAWAMIGWAMRRSTDFGRLTAWSGILAGATWMIAVILEHVSTRQEIIAIAIGFYFAAIVSLLLWVVLLGRRLLQLGREAPVSDGPAQGRE